MPPYVVHRKRDVFWSVREREAAGTRLQDWGTGGWVVLVTTAERSSKRSARIETVGIQTRHMAGRRTATHVAKNAFVYIRPSEKCSA